MKKIFNLKYIAFIGLFGLLLTSCEDDEAISAGEADPLNKEVVNIDATIESELDAFGEGKSFEFTVTLPSSFQSDATVTVTLDLDNGARTTGTAIVEAGSTTGTGSITAAPDDSVETDTDYLGSQNAARLYATAILLDELVPGTTYTISSNVIDLAIYDTLPDTDPAGLTVFLDWANPDVNDLDLYLLDFPVTGQFDASESGSRYEEILMESADYADGTYSVAVASFTAVPAGGTPLSIVFIRPTGDLEVFNFTYPEGSPGEIYVSFEKTTDPETGVISYTNFTIL